MNDFLDRYIFEQKDVRACYVSLKQSLFDNHFHHHYPESVQLILGEFMAACALLSSSLKFEGRLVLQLRSESDVPLLMAECNHLGQVRAYAQVNEACSDITFEKLEKGVLALTVQPDQGEAYQGIVPLDGDNLAACLQHYFFQSEQLGSYFYFHSTAQQVHGFMLQQLPAQLEKDAVVTKNDWETLQYLAQTLSHEELSKLDSQEIIHRLFHQETIGFLERKQLEFHCSCSKSKMEKVLISLGRSELEEILIEQGQIDMSCEFCQQRHVFVEADIAALFSEQPILH